MTGTPRTTLQVFGHESAQARLVQAAQGARLHHAWLLTGPSGIGKATLAWLFAKWLLAGAAGSQLQLSADHPVVRRVHAGGHADLIAIEPNDKGNIAVDDVREITKLFRQSAAEGGYRIAIIDNADAMPDIAQNALLKILEEPPPGALLLLTTALPGRLLPTIRSRVQILPLAPLLPEQLEALLAAQVPELDSAGRSALARLAGGSIGQALALHAVEGVQLLRELVAILGALQELPAPVLLEFAEKLGRKGGEGGYGVIAAALPDLLASTARYASGLPACPQGLDEQAVLQALAARLGLENSLALWDNIRDQLQQASRLNLDCKQTLLSALLTIKEAAA